MKEYLKEQIEKWKKTSQYFDLKRIYQHKSDKGLFVVYDNKSLIYRVLNKDIRHFYTVDKIENSDIWNKINLANGENQFR